ncbi:MAG TPA: hypothetical protein H9685_05365 [Firmicutes bacterium]|nr:hypothetical protein [Bacillota bacterium]
MNVYIRGKKIKIKGGKIIARFKKRGLFSDKYDLYDGNGNFVLCMIKGTHGLAASDDFDCNNIVFELSQDKSVQIGLGPRFLSSPFLPLYEIGVGAYTGESTYGSLVLKGKRLYLDNNLIAEFHIHGGYLRYLTRHYVRISDKMKKDLLWQIAAIMLFLDMKAG